MNPHPQDPLFELARTAYQNKQIESLIQTHGVLPPLASTFIEAAMHHGDVSPIDVSIAQQKWAHEWKAPILEQIASGQPLTYEKKVLQKLLECGYVHKDEICTAVKQGLTERPLRAIEAIASKGPGLLSLKDCMTFKSKLGFISPKVVIDPISPSNWIEYNIDRYLLEGIHKGMYTQNDINDACFDYLQRLAVNQIPFYGTKRDYSPQDLFLVDLASFMGFLG